MPKPTCFFFFAKFKHTTLESGWLSIILWFPADSAHYCFHRGFKLKPVCISRLHVHVEEKKGGSAIRLCLTATKTQNPAKIVHGFSWYFRVFFRSKLPKLRQLTKNEFSEFWKMRCKKIAIASWLALKIK